MAFTEVPWANLDVVTEVKLDQMVANDVHVREESNYKPVLNVQMQTDESSISSAGAYIATLTVSVNSGAISLGGTTSGSSGVTGDVNISALAEGIHTIDISLNDADDTSNNAEFRFYKSPDMTYLTCFYRVYERQGSGNFLGSASVTVIGHRETKSWT